MGKRACNSPVISLSNVPTTASQYDVVRAIANVLHGNAFKEKFCKNRTRPLNFRVTLEPDGVPSSIRNSGRGALIMPSPDMSEHFMQFLIVNELRIRVGNKALRFTPVPQRKPDREIVQILNLVPFQDPNIAELKEALLKELIYQIPVLKLQLGVFVYNPSDPRVIQFSIEWERDYRDHGDARLAFEYEHKMLRLKSSDPADTIIQSVILEFINLRRIYTGWDAGSPHIIFELPTPPAFEQEDKYPTLTGHARKDTKGIRQRLSYLDDLHAKIAPYVHQVRLILKMGEDLDVFHDMCNKAGLAIPISVPPQCMDVACRTLYSSRNLDRIHRWIEKQAYPIAFQCEALIRNHLLNPLEFLDIIPRIESLIDDMLLKAQYALLHFHTVLKVLYNRRRSEKETIADALERAIAEYNHLRSSPGHRDDNTYFMAHRVTFTPTGMRLEGPYTHQSNRVIRKYPGYEDHFIRVDFRDEDRLHYRWSRETDGSQFIDRRVGSLLKNGFTIAGRKFEFLGYSSSQLRSHSVFASSPFEHDDPSRGLITAHSLRLEAGIFDESIYCPALYAARISQVFSATEDSVTLLRHQWEQIPDIERNNRKFTDGVGTISPQLAEQMWKTLCDHRRTVQNGFLYPVAFQIRFGGYKGVVAVDYRLKERGIFMRLRKSMRKFEIQDNERIPIEVARPFIQILEDLGIDRQVFLDLQRTAVASVEKAKTSLIDLASLLNSHGLGKSFHLSFVIKSIKDLMANATRDIFTPEGKGCGSTGTTKLISSSPNTPQDFGYFPFLDAIIHTTVLSVLRDIKHGARIPVPHSWNLVGIADETGLLREGQVYVCIWERDNVKHPEEPSLPYFLEGPVLISRSPMIHPGDVRMATALGPPPAGSIYEKSLMPNVIIFSCEGERDLPSCLSGGDLDGDLYIVSKYEAFRIPDNMIRPPGDYPPPKRVELGRPSTIDDVAAFVVEYINSDVVGLVSTNHLILSDQSSFGTLDPRCLKLAKLCSQAVDYPKTGDAVNLSSMPRFLIPYKPDWKSDEEMNPRQTDYYESTRAIGYLYRAITFGPDGSISGSVTNTRRSSAAATSYANVFSSRNTAPLNLSSPSQLLQTSMSDPLTTALESEILMRLKETTAIIPANFSSPTETDYELYNIPSLFNRYALELKYICVTHTLSYDPELRLKEEEVVVGTILAKCKERRWRRDRIEQMQITIDQLVRMVLYHLRGGSTSDSDVPHEAPPDQRLLRGWMAWKYARTHTTIFGKRSFSLLALQLIFRAFGELAAEKKLSGDIDKEGNEI